MKKLIYKNGIIYNCKHFPFWNYDAIMFFWFIFTKESPDEFDKVELYHEQIHQMQYKDCIGFGGFVAIALLFVLLATGCCSYWLFMLALIPFTIYYILYLINFFILLIRYRNWNKAYRNICFERQAYQLQHEGNIVCQQRTPYISFSWLKYI